MYSKFCVGCGVELNINHKFCGKCGKEREEKESKDFSEWYTQTVKKSEDVPISNAEYDARLLDKSTLPETIEMKKDMPLLGGGGALPKNFDFARNEKERGQAKILGVFLLIICAGAFVVPISDLGTFNDHNHLCNLFPGSNPEACETTGYIMWGVYAVGFFGVLCLISGFRKS